MNLKKIISKYFRRRISYSKLLKERFYKSGENTSIINILLKTKIIKEHGNRGKQIKILFSKIDIGDCKKNENFYYNIDVFTKLYDTKNVLGNLCLDYSKILNYSLNDFKEKIKGDGEFLDSEKKLIEGIEVYISRICNKFKDKNKRVIESIQGIKERKASGFFDALQRILFLNQLMWQTGHPLNGLGRLDIILEKYYYDDLKKQNITNESAYNLVKEFVEKLHSYYYFKSNNLFGDNGQIIVLGGKEIDGKYKYNDLTKIFIKVIKELQYPDPKVLLRVTKDTPRELIELSVDCIKTGVGCPLFANDDIIIPKLIDFGYELEDAYNYSTSACWEPYIAGKSVDPNNIDSIVFIKPLNNLLDNEDLKKFDNFESIVYSYKEYLSKYLEQLVNDVNNIRFEEDPLLSLFIEDCIKKQTDISIEGAKYNNYGLTSVSLGNTINALINIKYYVFDKKIYSLEKLNEIRKSNFKNNEDLIKKLKNENMKYGTDNEEIINLTNDIIEYTSKELDEYKNYLGGKFKFGLSAPSYVTASKDCKASLDGRKNDEPFLVHISSDNANAYTELISFSSKIDYGDNRFNGNVVDFVVSPNFIDDNYEKFVDFLMLSIRQGFFEMQMNVVSSNMLLEAKKNPEKFPNLIVRVWGFSAYFKDLPEEYKNVIIERTLKSEGKL